ncbi:hypothetical protein R5R35_008315 [Gryllus longicercus]
MCAWQIHSYGDLGELRMSDCVRVPKLLSPDDILIEVFAASVNPIDIAMMGGYGSSLLNAIRRAKNCEFSGIEFPLSLGRDFSGIVVAKGYQVSGINVGDEVWGVVPPHSQGSHAGKVLVNKSLVQLKPKILTRIEAGSMPYTAMTAWSSLKITGDLMLTSAKTKKVLVLGSSGGVGTMAVQLLKIWGAQVIATCRTDATSLIESLGADGVIDYTHPDAWKMIKELGKYDIILDAAGLGSEKGTEYAQYLKDLEFSKYITLKSPLLHNVDQYGFVGGMIKNLVDIIVPNIKTNTISTGSTVRWGFFIPLAEALHEISHLAEDGRLTPCVEKIYGFNDVPAAFERVMCGHLRGKIVIDVQNKLVSTKKD